MLPGSDISTTARVTRHHWDTGRFGAGTHAVADARHGTRPRVPCLSVLMLMATTLLVVPRSMPMILAMSLLPTYPRLMK